MRVSLAGFGGSLVGLSLARQRREQQHLRGPAAKKIRAPDTNLSAAWAFTCMAFVGIIEVCTQYASLTEHLGISSPALQTIGDYTLGGAIAGATFRGMHIRPYQRGRSSAASRAPTLTPRIVSGLIPGVVLGCLAGIFVYGANIGLQELDRYEQQQREALYEKDKEPAGSSTSR
jgi:hypothetical protein